MIKPKVDFFVIGAARCGTTSLYRVLEQHPDVFVPSVKEPRFFKENWENGWDWYAGIFEGADRSLLAGDFSPSYSTASNNVIASRIYANYPDAKIIYIVRNPIDCAISNWRMIAEIQGREISFEDALEEWSAPVLERALFWRQVSYFREFFPGNRIKVVALEVLRSQAEAIQEVFEFLGLERRDITFPKANASARKPNRPGKPDTSLSVRRRFISEVSDDARQVLQYANLPSIWSLGTGYKGWTD